MADKPEPKEPVIEPEEPKVPAPEVTPPEEEVEAPEVEAEEPEEEPEEEPKPPSRREQLRIQDVLAKRAEAAANPQLPADSLDYATALDAEPELIKRLEADRQAAINAAVSQNNAQLQTYRWETLLNLDAPTIEQRYPQLDKQSEDFHPALANAISSMYLSAAGYNQNTGTVTNPNIRYKDYVESVFELANEIAGEKIEVSTKNIKKQAARTAIRPGGGTAKRLNLNQTPNAMSDEELNAKIEQDLKALGLA